MECIRLRNAYAYPPARLVRTYQHSTALTATWNGREYLRQDPAGGWLHAGVGYSSMKLDTYHKDLLTSGHTDANVDGLISVIYWGYFAGWVFTGKLGGATPTTAQGIAIAVAAARGYLAASDFASAISAIQSIAYIGWSFASKVVAFLDPEHCGVLDSVVAGKLSNSTHSALTNIGVGAQGFDQWCRVCVSAAQTLNVNGAKWTDWDGAQHAWRAIDVERVVFACPVDPGSVIIWAAERRIATSCTSSKA
jgi:hypothetical protein